MHGFKDMSILSRLSPLSLRQLSALSILFVATALVVACGGSGVGEVEDAELDYDPNSFSFSETMIGDTAEETVTLFVDEDDDATVIIRNPAIEPDPTSAGAHEVFELVDFPDGDEIEIAPGEELDVTIEYTPEDSEPYNGLFSFSTNISDDDQSEIDIPISAAQSQPDMFAPSSLSLDRVPTNASASRVIDITNLGSADLEIDDVALSGPDDFSLSYPTPVDEIDESELEGDAEQDAYDLITEDDEYGRRPLDADEPPEAIPPNETAWVRVHYEAPSDDFQSAIVNLVTNDPDAQPNHSIAVSVNSEAACLELVGGQVDFGPSALGRTTQETFTINNCSTSTETIVIDMDAGLLDEDTDSFSGDADIPFEINEETLPQQLQDGNNLELAPDESFNFRMRYAPEEEQVDEAVLELLSTDEASPMYIDILGEGVDAECPIASAVAGIQGAGAVSGQQVLGIPLDIIEFDGTESSDPDNTELSYEWSITERPPNSTAQLNNPDTATPTLETDIAGRFVIELTVYDELGIGSCQPAEITADIEPEAAIHAELTWDVPASDDLTGTDLDLHYLHPSGEWSQEPWGVYYGNPNPSDDWADGSEVWLDIDSLDGGEPENINHDNPDPSYDYSVGVYYFGDSLQYGATDARIRIYLNNALFFEGEQRFETAGSGDAGAGDFWLVGDVIVQGDVLDFEEIDNFMEDAGFPN